MSPTWMNSSSRGVGSSSTKETWGRQAMTVMRKGNKSGAQIEPCWFQACCHDLNCDNHVLMPQAKHSKLKRLTVQLGWLPIGKVEHRPRLWKLDPMWRTGPWRWHLQTGRKAMALKSKALWRWKKNKKNSNKQRNCLIGYSCYYHHYCYVRIIYSYDH